MAGEATFKLTFVDNVTAGARRASSSVSRLQQQASKFGGASSAFTRVAGAAAAMGVSIGGAALAAKVLKTGLDFEQTLVNAAAKFPGDIHRGTQAFQQLEDAAKHVGATTEFTSTQSAQALNYLAMAGFDAKQSIAALPGVVNLATASQTDLGTASDMATDALGAFNLTTKDAAKLGANLARVNDVMAKTAVTSNTSVTQLFEAMKEGGPVATSAGASIETFSALAGQMANAGIKGGIAGTTLKNVFIRLTAPVGKASATLRELGIQTKDAQGNMLDVVNILGQFSRATKNMGTAEKAKAIEEVFGRIPLAGVNVLLSAGEKKLADYRSQLEKAGGSADKMAATMRDTTQGALKTLISTLESLGLQLFDVVHGPLEDTIKATTEWIRANKDLIAIRAQAFFDRFVEVLTIMSPLLDLAGILVQALTSDTGLWIAKWAAIIFMGVKLIGIVGSVISFVGSLSGVIGAVITAGGWLVTVVEALVFVFGGWAVALAAGLVAAIAAVVVYRDEIGAFFSGLKDSFVQWGSALVDGLVEGIKSMWNAPIETISSMGSAISNAFTSFFGIKSPSKLAMEWGVNIGAGLDAGLSSVPSAQMMADQIGAAPAISGGGTSAPNVFHITVNPPPGATEEDGRRYGESFAAALRREWAHGFGDMALELGAG